MALPLLSVIALVAENEAVPGLPLVTEKVTVSPETGLPLASVTVAVKVTGTPTVCVFGLAFNLMLAAAPAVQLTVVEPTGAEKSLWVEPLTTSRPAELF